MKNFFTQPQPQPRAKPSPTLDSLNIACMQSLINRIGEEPVARVICDYFQQNAALKEKCPGIYLAALETLKRDTHGQAAVQAAFMADHVFILLVKLFAKSCVIAIKLCCLLVLPRRSLFAR